MPTFISAEEAAALTKDGARIMLGGFLGVGSAQSIIDELVKNEVKDLDVIVNDSGFPESGSGKLFAKKQIKRLTACYLGGQPACVQQMNDGGLEVDLIPQGSLAEAIRAGGAGLGGVLTKVGLGTVVEEGKQKVTIDGEEWLLHKPLRAEVAYLHAHTVDTNGNCVFHGTARNFNPIMALAADTVVVEAVEVVEAGRLDPDQIHVPGVVVDYIVKVEK